jgi:RHS repeat-associated protein
MNLQGLHALLLRLGSLLLVATLWPQLAAAQTTVKYVHTDALGSVVAMTDASGAVVDGRREYEAYGQQLTPALQGGPGYTGHVQDEATGLTYMQQRYYEPQLGVLLSVDPVSAYEQPINHFNRYRYANNNPYKFVDPDGREVRYAQGASEEFYRNAARAIRYLNRNAVATNVGQVHRRSEVVTIRPAVDRADAGQTNFDPNTNTITWADKGGIEVKNYQTGDSELMSPALALGHEFEHALNKLEAPDSFNLDKQTFDSQYRTQEERNVIELFERPAAQKLGEGQRSSHSGKRAVFECSTPKCE